ncbi:Plant intracellular Ras-group-related LRR protein 4-like protein [Drosera capensis]
MAASKKPTAVESIIETIMQLHRSLPPRPLMEDLEAATTLIRNLDREDQRKLDSISKKTKPHGVPDELFHILIEMERRLVRFSSAEERKAAAKVIDLEETYVVFDDMIQRASDCVSNGGNSVSSRRTPPPRPPGEGLEIGNGGGGGGFGGSAARFDAEKESVGGVRSEKLYVIDDGFVVKSKNSERFAVDDSFVKKPKSAFHVDGMGRGGGIVAATAAAPQIVDKTLTPNISAQSGEKLSLIKLASLIEVSAKKGTRELNLGGKLVDQVEWLPDSIGKLLGLLSLDLSENRLVTLPPTIGGLSSLTKLDLHSNRIVEVPDSIGELLNLVSLDLAGNQLSRLPSSIGRLVRLEDLNLSSNQFVLLPDAIGSLVSLKKLGVETNNLEELPHSIGQCVALKELYLDYNRLKALPEAVGKIETLEVLTMRYNNVRQLPTTMASLTKLKELNVSFNELESVPESLCFATSLVKLNIGNNFANLRMLPRSIGNLENLEELDISNNQIRILPDSFQLLTPLRILRADQNPLEVPPRQIAEKGAQAVVQYIADLVANRDSKVQPVKQKKTWVQICCFSQSNKRKRYGADYVQT